MRQKPRCSGGGGPLALLAAALLALMAPTPVRAAEVVALLDARLGPYAEAYAAFRQASTAEVMRFDRTEDGDPSDERALVHIIRNRHPDQILAIGAEALEVMVKEVTDIPIVFCMVLNPRAKLASGRDNVAGVALDVAPEEQMKYLERLVPNARRVGVLYDPDESGTKVDEARVWLKRDGRRLVAEAATASPSLPEQVRAVLERSDVYWMLPDRTGTDPDVLRLLFFQSSAGGKPLIGVSDQYVKAGALFALTPDPAAVGRQAAALSNRALAGTPLRDLGVERAAHPFLSINRGVAKALGIPIGPDLLKEVRRAY